MAAQDLNELIKKTKAVALRDKVLQSVFQSVHVATEIRIFKKGLDAQGQLIGIYSKGYRKTRRKKNYPRSKKVILQATSQMVNDYKFLVLQNNEYGSGFSNTANYDKSIWVEKMFDREIFKLSDEEERKMEKWIDAELDDYLNKL